MPVVPPGTERAHVFIKGRVQGVGFRAFTQRQANILGVRGYVRNLPDGRVEAVIEGPAATVSELLEKLKTGPRAARVEDLAVTKEAAEGDFEGFEIVE
ncbi:MAG: acylphosphatase [Verrucomicrobia bacterium]|nr:acylphosphatase [Verrucomicrobiota bacterium]